MPMISRFAKAFLTIMLALLLISTLAFIHTPTRSYIDPWTGNIFGEDSVGKFALPGSQKNSHDAGAVIMGKLGNETAKAELGRATWKLLHTMTLRFPVKPTEDERGALKSYFHLTSRLYPCGECAMHFQKLLEQFPPQTSSRRAASLWLCSVHNQVNERLGKPAFDCSRLEETYDCGCGEDPDEVSSISTELSSLQRDEDDLTGVRLIKGGR